MARRWARVDPAAGSNLTHLMCDKKAKAQGQSSWKEAHTACEIFCPSFVPPLSVFLPRHHSLKLASPNVGGFPKNCHHIINRPKTGVPLSHPADRKMVLSSYSGKKKKNTSSFPKSALFHQRSWIFLFLEKIRTLNLIRSTLHTQLEACSSVPGLSRGGTAKASRADISVTGIVEKS